MTAVRLTALTLLMAVAVVAPAAEKVKLTGVELAERNSKYAVRAGVSHTSGVSWMVVAYANGTRDLYWNDGSEFGTDSGTHRVLGHQSCVTWKNTFGGEERCYDVYRIGLDKYQSWRNGDLEYTYYKIR